MSPHEKGATPVEIITDRCSVVHVVRRKFAYLKIARMEAERVFIKVREGAFGGIAQLNCGNSNNLVTTGLAPCTA
eukprot:IDg12275t1